MAPRISLVIPAYNCESLVGECLDSILAQTMADFEVIAVDDGSADSTLKVLEDYAGRDGRIRVIHQENAGVSMARNAGIKAARGDILGFADADDYLEPFTFERIDEAFRSSEADAVICGYFEETDTGEEVPHALEAPRETGRLRAVALFYETYFTAVWNKYFRRERIPAGTAGEFPTGIRIGEDEIWLAQVSKCLDRFLFLPDVCYHWRFCGGSAVHRGKRFEGKSFREAEKISSLYARKKMLELSADYEPGVKRLVREKHFRICFDIMSAAYLIGNRDLYRECRKRCGIGRREYFASSLPSLKGKLKILAMDMGMRLGLSRKLIGKIDSFGQYHVDIQGIGKQKKENQR